MMKNALLCVDDEPLVVHSLRLIFEEQFDVFTFTNPMDALEEFKRNERIIAVISDHRMAVMNGFEMFKLIKVTHPHRKTFNVIYTGFSELEGDVHMMIESKIIDKFMTKSCPARMLIKTIQLGVQRIQSQRNEFKEAVGSLS